ncbi:MAG: prepilin-type N-terminal cleavage/methylation domain-containing protein [Phycisphaerae bacterium]|nr:prepilin-type N-terminal cleavage/methylation domain-containing protein [Phycisphaerae bacterium]
MVQLRRCQCHEHRSGGFTLLELLVAVAIIALLLSILLPTLGRARQQARTAVCASNVRQLAIANTAYSSDDKGHYCPAAVRIQTENLHRWHGTRRTVAEPFDPQHGPLVPYLGVEEGIRACPSFREFVTEGEAPFEKGGGGYGYNQAYVGRVLRRKSNNSFELLTDEQGVMSERVRRPAETLMFADTAFAAVARGVIEYSFAEPRFHPQYVHFQARMDPSIHFRHNGQVNVAWCDGHVNRRLRSFTWKSICYDGDPARENLGWFGQNDDNSYFDLE